VLAGVICALAAAPLHGALTRTGLGYTNGSGTSVSKSSLSVTAGDMIVVLAAYGSWSDTSTLSASATNMGTLNWNQVSLEHNPNGTKRLITSIFYAIVNSTTSTGSVTITSSASSAMLYMDVHKVSGTIGGVYGRGVTV